MAGPSDEAVEPLLAVWREAAAFLAAEQSRIGREIAREAAGTNRAGRLRLQHNRVEALAERADRAMADVRAASGQWLEVGLPGVYEAGARSHAGADWNWTQPHAQAVEAMAVDTWADVLATTRFVEADTRRFIADVAAREGRLMTTTGRTVAQAGREAARTLGERGIAAVQYADGSFRGIRDYSDMLLRTKSAVAYNTGTLNSAEEAGVSRFMLRDGLGCGVFAHGDGSEANGMVVSAEVARAYPISHPRAVMAGQEFLAVGETSEVVRARYVGPSVTIRTLEDHRATVSPNHPVLTLTGWRPAAGVRPGEYVAHHGVDVQATGVGTVANLDDVPLVEEAAEALFTTGPFAVGVPAPHDLHGDAQFCDPQVDVVRPDRPLLGHLPSLGLEGTREPMFGVGGVQDEPFLRPRPRLDPFAGLGDAERGGVAGGDLGGSLFWGHLRPRVAGRVAAVAGRVPAPFPSLAECGLVPVESSPVDDLLGCLPGHVLGVEFGKERLVESSQLSWHGSEPPWAKPVRWVKVAAVEVAAYDGWVYDFSTSGHAYTVAGLVVANCVRVIIPRPDLTNSKLPEMPSPGTPSTLSAFKQFDAQAARRTGVPARQGTVTLVREGTFGGSLTPADVKAATRAAKRSQRTAGERREATRGPRRPSQEILDEFEVTEDQWREARALVDPLRRDVRQTAKREADELGGWLSANDLASMTRPPRLRQSTNMFGRKVWTRGDEASGYDWLEQVPRERQAVYSKNRWVESDLYSPDEVAETVRKVAGEDLWSDDEAFDWLRSMWDREDALRSVAKGRIPHYYDDLDSLLPPDAQLQGFRLETLFDKDLDRVAGHAAGVHKAEAVRYARSALKSRGSGLEPPWAMDLEDYVDELTFVEDRVRSIRPLSDDEWTGPVYSADDNTYLNRWAELVPDGLDEDPENPLSAEQLWERIAALARQADLDDDWPGSS